MVCEIPGGRSLCSLAWTLIWCRKMVTMRTIKIRHGRREAPIMWFAGDITAWTGRQDFVHACLVCTVRKLGSPAELLSSRSECSDAFFGYCDLQCGKLGSRTTYIWCAWDMKTITTGRYLLARRHRMQWTWTNNGRCGEGAPGRALLLQKCTTYDAAGSGDPCRPVWKGFNHAANQNMAGLDQITDCASLEAESLHGS